MAKGNMLLGRSRGSVGDVTFSVVKGQQVQKARNRQPANPRTLSQSFQRARFAAAVKFYTRGNQALYKFAFENKRSTESDYNAFMRENVKIAPAISKAAFDNYDYPVVAPFIMSKGSIAPLTCTEDTNNFNWVTPISAEEADPTTIGQLSSLLLENEAFQAGDIITVVTIVSNYNGTLPSVDATGSGATAWTIKQFIIDTTSTATIADALGMTVGDAGTVKTLISADITGKVAGFAVIHSRESAQGLKVSTQSLVLSTTAETAFNAEQADAYKQAVAASWKTVGKVDMQPEAILQGSIAYDQQ